MLTREQFSAKIRSILTALHMEEGNYIYSFVSGWQPTGIPVAQIKTMGRWQSDVYQQYIRTPPEDLAKLSKRLVSPTDQQKQ